MNRYANILKKYDPIEQRFVQGFRVVPQTDESLVFTIILQEKETFESLAYTYYGSSKLWWVIADQNPLINPLALTMGTRIRVLKRQFLPGDRLPARFGE
jgi:hypothetical protein